MICPIVLIQFCINLLNSCKWNASLAWPCAFFFQNCFNVEKHYLSIAKYYNSVLSNAYRVLTQYSFFEGDAS